MNSLALSQPRAAQWLLETLLAFARATGTLTCHDSRSSPYDHLPRTAGAAGFAWDHNIFTSNQQYKQYAQV